MKKAPIFTILIALALLLSAAGLTGLAQAAGADEYTGLAVDPGNQCIACHSGDDPRLDQPYQWLGPVDSQAINPCPGSSLIQEEIYYTDRLFLAIDRFQSSLPAWIDSSKIDRQIQNYSQNYARLLETPATSAGAISAEAMLLRYKLGKVYYQLSTMNDQARQTRILFFAGLVTLIVVLSLVWGFYNTRRLSGGAALSLKLPAWSTIGVLLIFVLFALPIFRSPTAPAEAATEIELERLTAMDEAQRAADASERAESRVWALSNVGALLAELDPEQSQQAVEAAASGAEENRLNSLALWGNAHAARELAAGNVYALDQASVAVHALDASRSRAWGLNQAASDWVAKDPALASSFLEQALLATQDSLSPYHDLDLRAIAVTWSRLDPNKSLPVLRKIDDPALRSWGYREVAQKTGDQSFYSLAAEAARQVSNPIQRSRLLREIGRASGDRLVFQEALNTLESDPALQDLAAGQSAFAVGLLAAASQDAALAERIDASFPGARVLAYYGLGDYQTAWTEASQIADPYEKAHAQAAIASAWQNLDKARLIEVPLLREKAMRDIMTITGDTSLLDQIQLVYYRVEILTILGQTQAAWEAASSEDGLYDTYPLSQLAVELAATDPETASEILESMDREVDKARVLTALAVSSQDEAVFERALGMALAARVSGDVLAPYRASIHLAQGMQMAGRPEQALAAYQQALEIASRIPIK
jgi:hypothetical protein